MDVSPILISMKTAAVSILVTFFLGVFCARLVVGLQRPNPHGARRYSDAALCCP